MSPADDELSTAPPRHPGLWFALVATLSPLVYCWYTQHIWEDFFILFRHSVNLVEGNGLVFNPGERVHGYTSPLGVLAPALAYLVSGKDGYLGAIWIYRALNIGLFVAAGLLMVRSFPQPGRNRLGVVLFTLLIATEAKSIVYLSSGMETAFVLAFLSTYLYTLHRSERRGTQPGLDSAWRGLGISCAGLMWSRPDCALYIALLFVATLLFRPGPRGSTLATLLKAAGLCTVLYLPWFVWAWIYYGSPVPHSVVAKSAVLENFVLSWAEIVEVLQAVYSPVYYTFGGWPAWMPAWSLLMAALPALYWMLPTSDHLGRIASFVFFGLLGYYVLAPGAPWYYPPMAFLGLVVWGRAACAFAASAQPLAWRRVALWTLIVLLGTGSVRLMIGTSNQMKVSQLIVEDGNRTRLGLWLKENVQPDENVYLEPLGYLGYFSGVRIDDYPGLVSPRVVELLNASPRARYQTIVEELDPDWVVLRPWRLERMPPSFTRDYRRVKTFDVTRYVLTYQGLPGMGYLLADAVFYVYRRDRPGADAPR